MNLSLLQREVILLRKKIDVIENMSDGKCSIVSKSSFPDAIEEKENRYSHGSINNKKTEKSAGLQESHHPNIGKHSVGKVDSQGKSIKERRLSHPESSKPTPNFKETLGKRDFKDFQSVNLEQYRCSGSQLTNITEDKVIEVEMPEDDLLKASGSIKTRRQNSKEIQRKKKHEWLKKFSSKDYPKDVEDLDAWKGGDIPHKKIKQ